MALEVAPVRGGRDLAAFVAFPYTSLLAAARTCSSVALLRDACWRAATSLREGLGETARWYRQAGWL